MIAEELTRRIVARWAGKFDLWQLPTVPDQPLARARLGAGHALPVGRELRCAVARPSARHRARAPARNLAIVNGHGGNRGVLDNLIHELTAIRAQRLRHSSLRSVEGAIPAPSRRPWREERNLGHAGVGAASGAPRPDGTRPQAPPTGSHRGAGVRPRVHFAVAHRRSRLADHRRDRGCARGFARARACDHRQRHRGSRGVLDRLLENQRLGGDVSGPMERLLSP